MKSTLLFLSLVILLCACNDEAVDPIQEIDPRSDVFINAISGDEQQGFINQRLAESLIFVMLDSAGSAIPNINVEINGDGTFLDDQLISDDKGEIEIEWTLGNRYFNVLTINISETDAFKEASFSLEVKAVYPELCN